MQEKQNNITSEGIPLRINRYLYVSLFLIGFFLTTFIIIEAFKIPLLRDPRYLFGTSGITAAVGGILLLGLDVILPVPGSLVMIGNGALFGIVAGTFLSLLGGLLASVLGYNLGRKGNLILNKFISENERDTAIRLMNKWGYLAIIVTRPIPLLSETVIVIAGSTGIKSYKVILASLLGLLPASFIYALVGASVISIESSVYSFLTVLAVAGLFWVCGKIISRK